MRTFFHFCRISVKVHLVRKESVEDYLVVNTKARSSFETWLNQLKEADWYMPSDIIKTFPLADILGKSSNRAVFNIGGNTYRVICWYKFGTNGKYVHIFIKWIGTHAEYDKLCDLNKQYTVNAYKSK